MINVVLFDLGSTLLYSPAPWPPFFKQAYLEMLDALRGNGINFKRSIFLSEIQGYLDDYYEQREVDHMEPTWTVALREFLANRNYPNVPDPVLRAALDALFAVTQTNWVLEEDAHPTLRSLEKAGYRLGIISNAADDRNVQQLVDRWELRSYFEFILTSAACGIRKPRPEIFLRALEYFDSPAQAVAMVGDTLEADVAGANNLGIYSIWITRRTNKQNTSVVPKAVIERLDEIPGLLSKVNHPPSI